MRSQGAGKSGLRSLSFPRRQEETLSNQWVYHESPPQRPPFDGEGHLSRKTHSNPGIDPTGARGKKPDNSVKPTTPESNKSALANAVPVPGSNVTHPRVGSTPALLEEVIITVVGPDAPANAIIIRDMSDENADHSVVSNSAVSHPIAIPQNANLIPHVFLALDV